MVITLVRKREIKKEISKNLEKVNKLTENTFTLYEILRLAREEVSNIVSAYAMKKGIKSTEELSKEIKELLLQRINSLSPSELDKLLTIFVYLKALDFYSKEYIEVVRIRGTLITSSSCLYKLYEDKSYKVGSCLIPYVNNKKNLLTVIAAMSPGLQKHCIENNILGWITGEKREELIKIFKDTYKDKSKLLDYYPELAVPLYALLHIVDDELKEKIKSIPSRSFARNNSFHEIWEDISNRTMEFSTFFSFSIQYLCENGSITIYWSEVFELRKYSENIEFWYNLAKSCREKIEKILRKECKSARESYLQEIEVRNSLTRRV